jgi:hypothetical protein
MDTEMHNLMPGTLVTHPQFPKWGKGVITAIFFDTQTSKHIAKVMWETPLLSHAALHTLSHLQPFDAPKVD